MRSFLILLVGGSVSMAMAFNNLKVDTRTILCISHEAAMCPHQSMKRPLQRRVFSNHGRGASTTKCSPALYANDAASDGDEVQHQKNDLDNENGAGLTALPPIGASSFWNSALPRVDQNSDGGLPDTDGGGSSDGSSFNSSNNNNLKDNIILSEHTSIVSSKFQIQYTCKVCSTRNSHSVSRLAYRKGVVIAMCKGCLCRHLLADNLGWNSGFNFVEGETNIEIYMQNKLEKQLEDDENKENDLVQRVNRDVFDLEHIMYKGQDMDVLPAIGIINESSHDVDGIGWS